MLDRVENICCLFIDGIYCCFFFLLSNLDYLSMIRHDSDLCYDIYNILTEHNRKQSHYLLSIPNYFDTYFLVKQNVFL